METIDVLVHKAFGTEDESGVLPSTLCRGPYVSCFSAAFRGTKSFESRGVDFEQRFPRQPNIEPTLLEAQGN